MHLVWRLALKIAANGAALYLAVSFLPGFKVPLSFREFLLAALVLALINLILRPILKLISFPFLIVTFGLFNIVINAVLLWVATRLMPLITITDVTTLLIASVIIGFANAIV